MGFGFSGVIDYARGDYKLLGRDENTGVVSDNLSARWDTTGWRLGIRDSKFHIEPRKKHGFQKGKATSRGPFLCFFSLQLWSSCQWVERISDTFYIWKFSWIRTIIRFPEWTKIEKMRTIATVNRWTTTFNALVTWQTNQSGRYLWTAQGFCALLAWLVFEDVEEYQQLRLDDLTCDPHSQGLAWWCKWRLNRRDNHSRRWRNFVVWFPRFLPRGPTRKTRSLRDGYHLKQ